MRRISVFAVRHRFVVALVWLVALVAGAATVGTTTERLTFDFSLPGQPGYETEVRVLQAYGNGGSTAPVLPVVSVPEGETVEERSDEIAGVFEALRQRFPQVRVADFASTGDAGFVTDDGQSTFGLVFTAPPRGFDAAVEAEIAGFLAEQVGGTGLTVGLTGYDLLSEGSGGEAEEPNVLSETLLGAAGAFVVLVFVFASFLAFVPLIVAAVSILSTFLVLLGLTYLTDVSFVVQFLVSLIGLGVAIDYSLLVVTRWREERERGRSNDEAVHESLRTAGHAVVASALTVAVSLLALIAIPVPFLRSMGLGGMLIPLLSTMVVLTLLPALLSALGPRVDWPRIRHEAGASRSWTGWSKAVIRHRWMAAAGAVVLLGALVVPLTEVKIGSSSTASLANSGPAYEALQTLQQGGVPLGFLTPLEVLVEGEEAVEAAEQVVERVGGMDGVTTAFAPEEWHRPATAIATVIPERETVDTSEAEVVERVRDRVSDIEGVAGVAGFGALVLDYLNAVYKPFPLVLLLISLITYVLLVRAFRSLLLPLKAVALNVVSVAATFGAVVLFWQLGYGSEAVFGIEATGAITFYLPILIFAFLFGLSMDYEVFILARMREEYDRTGSTSSAVVTGLARTGRLVTSAALILFWAFVALTSAPLTDIKVLGTALGFGILLDATVVRALLVPALVSLFGKWNWWLPPGVARLLRVEPSPVTDDPLPRPKHRANPASAQQIP